jgi:hypothetical protein
VVSDGTPRAGGNVAAAQETRAKEATKNQENKPAGKAIHRTWEKNSKQHAG